MTDDHFNVQDSDYTVGAQNDVFAIVQKSVQSGPLRRSKPAYFKRASLVPSNELPSGND